MEVENLHENIKNKLDNFIINNNVPHIIFYGPNGAGKKYLLNYLIDNFYPNKYDKKKYILYLNCSHDKGINFIRNELKYFSKSNLYNEKKLLFKSVILFNADKLTNDAQSALRRSIEKFSNTTRFFIVVKNISKLLKPIISRFCNINVQLYNNINLYKIKHKIIKTNLYNFKPILDNITINNINNKINILYNNGISSINIIDYINTLPDNSKKYKFLIYYNKIKKDIKNEKLLMFYILYNFFIRKDIKLNNLF